ncbi:hypothetical protein CN957_06860 [Bacillus cereus]|uniref:DUF3888 domain-containing protein n=1 Tax=Bacillus paramycoides TaxID=2026194 RepID=UPI000BF50A55|nr:DUF3888 domain-containing protein [Bacillus paramycoides]PFD34855.1 hypothetical protein CN285_24810 [Bacillus cereus]PGM55816.1 hypothetical protein CN947_24755 [Bacillus cereus]PGM84698.1 hypothetical protein CN957_06860 [Bacillus cereus]PGW29230.1 hypothetical protein COE04_30345 [Bacillus cereus]
MKKTSFLLVITSLIIFSSFFPIQTKAIGYSKDDTSKYFNVDLTGYGLYSFGDFSQVGYKITPLAQLFFGIVQIEHEWINEPSLYIKGNKGYVHVWKENGTNVLYTVEKSDNYWRIVDIKRKKINRIPVSKKLLKEVLINFLLEPISKEVNSYYKEPKLWVRGFEKILKIEKDEANYIFYVTVQVQTFEGAHNPPYGEDTITFRIKGNDIKTINYKHRDILEEEFKKIKLR